MKTSMKFCVGLLATLIVPLIAPINLILFIDIPFIYIMLYGMAYYSGKEKALREVNDGAGIIASATGLVCDYCGERPQLIGTDENKWACKSCYTKYQERKSK